MQAFELSQLISEPGTEEATYTEFLRQPALSLGIYSLKAGAMDPQQPHTEDEAYYVVNGQGSMRLGNETILVKAGAVIYVPANEPHRFFNITEDMTILVCFAPAENTLAAKTAENPTSAS